MIWSVLSQFKWLLLFLHHAWRGHGARLSIRTKDPNNHSDTETGTLSRATSSSITSKSTCALNWGWRWGFSRIQNQPLILSRTPHSHSIVARTSLLSYYVFVQWKRWKEPASNIWRALWSHFEFNHCLKKNICFEWKIFLFSLLPKEQSLVEVMETLGSDEALPSAKLLPMKMKINTFSSSKEKSFCLLIQRELWLLSAKWLPIKKKIFGFWKRNIFCLWKILSHIFYGEEIYI